MKKTNTQSMVLVSIFGGIIILLAFTPIGFIHLGVIKATIVHVPVIVGSLLLGPKKGAALGFLFGATSLLTNTFTPALLSFAFSPFIPLPGSAVGSPLALLVCFVPRILVGIVPHYVYKACAVFTKERASSWAFAVAGVAGALTNTILVMGGIFVLFRQPYAMAKELPVELVLKAVLGIVVANGLPEAAVAGLISAVVCKALLKSGQVRRLAEKN